VIRAYRVVHETDSEVVYQYNAACGFWFYGAALLLLAAVAFELAVLTWLSAAALAPYMVFVYVPAIADARRIRAAIARGGVEVSGRRFSFSNPLTIRIRRRAG